MNSTSSEAAKMITRFRTGSRQSGRSGLMSPIAEFLDTRNRGRNGQSGIRLRICPKRFGFLKEEAL
jgi:hypothetical protein